MKTRRLAKNIYTISERTYQPKDGNFEQIVRGTLKARSAAKLPSRACISQFLLLWRRRDATQMADVSPCREQQLTSHHMINRATAM